MDCQSQSQFYKIVTNCKYNGSVYALYLPSLIELWDLAAVLHGFQARSQFYEILIVTNCKSNDCPEYTAIIFTIFVLELWDSSTR